MTKIAEYYAEAGVLIDKKSLANVRKMLNSVEKQMSGFGRKAFSSKSFFSGRNWLGFRKKLNHEFGKVGFLVNLNVDPRSLATMRSTVQRALSGITVTANVRPNVSAPRGGARVPTASPRGTVASHATSGGFGFGLGAIGGGAARMLRYGAYGLPFVAGAVGLNSIANRAQSYQALQSQLLVGAQNSQLAAQQFQYLQGLGNQYGYTSTTLAPGFARMFQGVRGTSLESQLPRGFESILQYSAVNNLNDDEMSRVLRALSQIVSKGTFQAEEVRGQLGDVLPAAEQMLARAVGVDRGKLNDMMQKRQLSAEKYLPAFLDIFRQEAQPGLAKYQTSIQRARGRSQQASQNWWMAFSNNGADRGLTNFFNTWRQTLEASLPLAEKFGNLFGRALTTFSAAMLIPKEMFDWMQGKESEGNFMKFIFGPSGDSGFLKDFQYAMEQIKNLINTTFGNGLVSLESTRKELEAIANILGPVLKGLGDVAYVTSMTLKHGTEGLKYASSRINRRDEVERELQNSPYSSEVRKKTLDAAMSAWDFANPAPGTSAYATPEQQPFLPSLWEDTKNSVSRQWQLMWGSAPQVPESNISGYYTPNQYNSPVQVNLNVKVTHDGSIDTSPDQEKITGFIDNMISESLKMTTLNYPQTVQ